MRVSPPYAAGKTTVFIPSGVAYAKKARVITSAGARRINKSLYEISIDVYN